MKKEILSILCFTAIVTIVSIASCKKGSTETPIIINTDINTDGDIVYILQQPSNNTSHNFKVYSINVDGSDNRQIINSDLGFNMPVWSPDLTKLAVSVYSGYNTSIYVYYANGDSPVRLTTTPNVSDMRQDWSPDGTMLTFTRRLSSQNDRMEIWTMNADGSNQQLFAEGFSSTWSPNGNKLIYASNKSGNFDLYTSDANGTNESKLTSSGKDEANPDLSPDGTKIAFTASVGVMRGSESSFEIWVMNVDGTNPIQLTNNSFFDGDPKWSPDGTKLLFCSDRSATDHSEIYTMDPDGTNVTRVTNSAGNATAIYPSWRPIIR